MADTLNLNLDYERPLKIAEGIYWVGFYDAESGLHCNPYLIIDNDEALLVDCGSRPDFPIVMMKILQTGIAPSAIKALSFSHFDPDVCGGISNFEEIIGHKDLVLISDTASHMFIRHYGITSPLFTLGGLGHEYLFSSKRRLRFFNIPYAHSEGSFITFDEKTGVLFTSDLFGSYSKDWGLFLALDDRCRNCRDFFACSRGMDHCPVRDILAFHRKIMPSERALRYAMKIIRDIPCTMIAPQHGSVISNPADIECIREALYALDQVGIEGILRQEEDRGI